jgi:hypothetical protein
MPDALFPKVEVIPRILPLRVFLQNKFPISGPPRMPGLHLEANYLNYHLKTASPAMPGMARRH